MTLNIQSYSRHTVSEVATRFRKIAGCTVETRTRLEDVSRRFRDNALKAAGTLSRFYLHGHSSAALTAITPTDLRDRDLVLRHTVCAFHFAAENKDTRPLIVRPEVKEQIS